MFLSEPAKTRYDLNFSLLGFPVRVHPAFFIMPLLLGSGFLGIPEINTGVALLVLISVFFVSILIHELGHAVAMRYYGQSPRILIYWMGGLAISDGGGAWGMRRAAPVNSAQKIIISLAGPVFGLLFAAVIVGIVYALGGTVILQTQGFIPFLFPDLRESPVDGNMAIKITLLIGLWANIFWNVLNLAPVFPLDGGQISRELFIMNDARNGVRYSIIVSIVVAILIALFSFRSGDQFLGVFFGFMAWTNYTSLQQIGGGFGGGRRPW